MYIATLVVKDESRGYAIRPQSVYSFPGSEERCGGGSEVDLRLVFLNWREKRRGEAGGGKAADGRL
jgi:hypothetical protein